MENPFIQVTYTAFQVFLIVIKLLITEIGQVLAKQAMGHWDVFPTWPPQICNLNVIAWDWWIP